MKTPMDFRNEVLGKGFDVDGSYGNQCWDGYAYYMKWLGYPFANCTVSGYVKDIYEQRETNGMSDSCVEVSIMQQGDIAVFKESPWTPDSHIAIFMRDLGGGMGLFLGQNQGGLNGGFNETALPYEATYPTAFRPKCYRDLFKQVDIPQVKLPDQILHKGSIVEFVGLLKVERFSNGLVYNSRIGGGVSPSICFEDSAGDGKQDQYFSTTNATFTIKGRYTVTDVQKRNGVWDAYLKELGFWVHCEPLVEVVDA